VDARLALAASARRLRDQARDGLISRARLLTALSRAPAAHLDRHRRALHQSLRELRASSRRAGAEERARTLARAQTLARLRGGAIRDCAVRRPAELERLRLALGGHDPQRTLARGYALVSDSAGEPVTSAAAARAAGRVSVRFADAALDATVDP
jgi:exodeoxyribonuclease VII large subunit